MAACLVLGSVDLFVVLGDHYCRWGLSGCSASRARACARAVALDECLLFLLLSYLALLRCRSLTSLTQDYTTLKVVEAVAFLFLCVFVYLIASYWSVDTNENGMTASRHGESEMDFILFWKMRLVRLLRVNGKT